MKKLFLTIFMVVFTSLVFAKESDEKGIGSLFEASITENSFFSADSLLGEFSLKPNGDEPFLRVIKEKGNYYFQLKEEGKEWTKRELLTLNKKEPTEKELKEMKELLGENFKQHTQSVLFVGIFLMAVKTTKNQKINDKYTCKTGYYIFSLFGGYSDLYKIESKK